MERIVLAVCISDSYAQHAAVVIASVLKSNPTDSFDFHILSGDLSSTNISLLKSMACDRLRIFPHAVDRARFNAYPIVVEYFSQEIFYRYLIPELINASRVIYTDVDVLVQKPIRQLWETPLTAQHPLAAVREINDASSRTAGWIQYKQAIGLDAEVPFFYSGLLLIDCDQLRKENAVEELFADTTWCAEHLSADDFSASDQVVINRVFAHRILDLPLAYCVTGAMLKEGYKGEIIIRHYAGYYEKPWVNIAWNWHWGAYWKTLVKTPYRNHAWGMLFRHLWSVIYSSHVKKGYHRAFLFGIRIYKKKVPNTYSQQ